MSTNPDALRPFAKVADAMDSVNDTAERVIYSYRTSAFSADITTQHFRDARAALDAAIPAPAGVTDDKTFIEFVLKWILRPRVSDATRVSAIEYHPYVRRRVAERAGQAIPDLRDLPARAQRRRIFDMAVRLMSELDWDHYTADCMRSDKARFACYWDNLNRILTIHLPKCFPANYFVIDCSCESDAIYLKQKLADHPVIRVTGAEANSWNLLCQLEGF
jgi:hypothetical protein